MNTGKFHGNGFPGLSASVIKKPAAILVTTVAAAAPFLSILNGNFVARVYSKDLAAVSIPKPVGNGDPDIRDLIAALSKGNADTRQRAAIELGASRDTRAVEPLISALNDEDNFVRSFAAKALGNIGDPRAVVPLIHKLNDRHILVQRSAALALGSLKDPRAVDHLIQALEKSEQFLLQRAAAKALGEIGDPKAVDPLIRILGSEDIYLQHSAATALSSIGGPAVPKLVDRLGDWNMGFRVAGILKDLHWRPPSDREKVLFNVAMRNKQALLDDWDTAKKILMEDANSDDTSRAQNAIFALISIGRDEVVDTLAGILGKKGNLEIASAFLNCGNVQLSEAARNWARDHENKLRNTEDSPVVKWGEMKKS